MLESVGGPVLNVAKVIVGIGFLIFIHELGHFLAAKLMNVRVEKFSLGFGKRLWGFTWGETQYQIAALPVGGFVKMAGENPGEQKTRDPRALNNQRAWRRAIIFVAGVVMNAVGALLLFVIAFNVGARFVSNRVGNVTGPAFRAGIQPGDRILAINGRRMRHFQDVSLAVGLIDPKRELSIRVERDGATRSFVLKPETGIEGVGFPSIGVRPTESTTVAGVMPGSPADAAGIGPGDRLLSIRLDTGTDIQLRTFSDLRQALRSAKSPDVTLEIEGPGDVRRTQDVRLERQKRDGFGWKIGRVVIRAIGGESPAAKAGLKDGDILLRADGADVTDIRAFIDFIDAHGGSPIALVVERGDEQKTITVTPAVGPDDGVPRIGVMLGVKDDDPPVVTAVTPGSNVESAGIPVGSTIEKVDGKPCKTVADMHRLAGEVLDKKDSGNALRFTIRTPDDEVIEKELASEEEDTDYFLGAAPRLEVEVYHADNLIDACAVGWDKTVGTIRQVVLTIRRILFTRSVKPDNVAGPVQIPVMAYHSAASGVGDFLFFLGILGANLAVVNLLPIPVLDGGQLVLLGIESIKGSPLSERAQIIAFWVGLSVIGLLFIYIVSQDLSKVFGL